MKGSLTLWDDSLLYIAFSIIGLSGKNEQEMKFGDRGVGEYPKRLMNPHKCGQLVWDPALYRSVKCFVTPCVFWPYLAYTNLSCFSGLPA